jgi:hypothetical protein
MKKLLMLIAMVVMGFLAMAQTNPISYQAVVRDANNRLAADSTVYVTVKILKADNSEQFSQGPITKQCNHNGLLSLTIDGAGLSSVNWEGAKFYTEITLGSQVMKDTVPVTAVPYALHGGLTPSDSAKIYAKIKADSIVLANRIEADSTVLADRITADSTLLAGRITADSILFADNIGKKADTSLVNLLDKQVKANTQAIKDTASQIRTWADTTFATVAKVKADSIVLHGALKDTAVAIRAWADTTFVKEVKNDTLILMSGVTPLDTFVSNAGSSAVVVDVKSKFTHDEEVDSVKNFVGATSVTEMNQMLTALKGNSAMFPALQDSMAYIAIDYLAAEMLKDTNNKTLLATAIHKLAPAISSLDAKDAKYYINRAKEFRALLTPEFKEDVKNELKYRIKTYLNSTEFKTEVKNTIKSTEFQNTVTDILSNTDVQNAILGNSEVQNIVEQLIIDNVNPTGFTATDVQTAINNAIVKAMGGSAGQTMNQAIKNILPTSITLNDGVNPPVTYTITWN